MSRFCAVVCQSNFMLPLLTLPLMALLSLNARALSHERIPQDGGRRDGGDAHMDARIPRTCSGTRPRCVDASCGQSFRDALCSELGEWECPDNLFLHNDPALQIPEGCECGPNGLICPCPTDPYRARGTTCQGEICHSLCCETVLACNSQGLWADTQGSCGEITGCNFPRRFFIHCDENLD